MIAPFPTNAVDARLNCARLAATFNARHIAPANMVSNFFCVQPDEYQDDMWMITMFAIAASFEDVAIVLRNTEQSNWLYEMAVLSGWPCVTTYLDTSCRQPGAFEPGLEQT
eukprot:249939-Chlamydomonas_euryale.AAC.1